MTLTPEQAKELIRDEQRRIELEEETRKAIREARAVLASSEALERRRVELAELKTHTAELRRIHDAITKADSELYKSCGGWINACLTRMSLDDQLVDVSARIGALSQKLGVEAPQGLVYDKSLFRKTYSDLGRFIGIYESTYLREGSRGQLSSFEALPE
jgi:DNA repair ATPase RecN